MTRVRWLLRMAPLVLITSCLGWCDLDPFGVTERRIVGRYRLKQWEDGQFHLWGPVDTGAVVSGLGGVPVERVGWDARRLAVLHGANGRALADGWTVIDVATGRRREVLRAVPPAADSDLARLRPVSPAAAWEQLGIR